MFIDSWRDRTRRALATPLAACLVAGGAVLAVVATPTAAQAADHTLAGDFNYRCHVVAENLDIGTHDVNVHAEVAVPDGVAAGDTVPARKTQITLTLSETLRNATYGILNGREAAGKSDDAAVELTINGEVVELPIANLSAPRTPVPATDAEPWQIPTEGDVPPIDVPADATGLIDIAMPERFTVDATVYTTDDKELSVNMDCKGPRKRSLGAIPIFASIDKSYAYTCGVMAGDVDLGEQEIGVRTQASLPGAVKAGESIPPTDTKVTLTLPEALRAATVDLLDGVTAGGSSDDTALGVTIGGQNTQTYPIEGLSAPQTPIPATAGEPWVIPTQGSVAAVEVPKDATGQAEITMPDTFTVDASIVNSDGETIPATMDCAIAAGSSTAFASVQIDAGPAPRGQTHTKATAHRVAYGHVAKVKATVSPKVSGKVRVYKGKRKLGTAKLNAKGKATVELGRKKLRPGRHELRVRYLGNDLFKASKDTTALRVTKAPSRVAAKPLSKLVVARKTRARVRVKVHAVGLHPSGKVVLRSGGRIVGKGHVFRGRVTVRLQKFAKPGSKTVRVRYAGTKLVKPGADKVKIRVVRRH